MKKYVWGYVLLLLFLALGAENNVIDPASNVVVFSLNDSEKIVMILKSNLDDTNGYVKAACYFIQGNDSYWLGVNTLSFFCKQLKYVLTRALNNRLQFNASIKQEIGFMWNEVLQENITDLATEDINGEITWVGFNNMIYSGSCAAWIYTYNNAILFKLTPVFRDGIMSRKYDFVSEADEKVPYEEWIKHYRPCLVRELSKDTVRQWLLRISCIVQTIEENMKRAEELVNTWLKKT
jgi:hypothetical protein